MKRNLCLILWFVNYAAARDEEKIIKACYWPNELYEPCFGGCAEVSCDNPRNHLRPCYPYCEPGCICEDPYVRDDRTHQCVLPQDCSPTQMGIPVPTKTRQVDTKPPSSKYLNRGLGHSKRDNAPTDLSENELSSNAINLGPTNGISAIGSNPKQDDYKRGEISRMGNYFNIVIAPPPIKALQPRKLLASDSYRSAAKRNS